MLLGRNINIQHGFVSAAKYAHETGSNVFQIFLKSPHRHGQKSREKSELIELRDSVKAHGQQVLVHGSFILNFCNPVDSMIHHNGIINLIADLNSSVILGAIGVVIHMGHNTCGLSNEKAIDNYIKGVQCALKLSDPQSIIILETGAGAGKEICTSLFDLGDLRSKFTISEQKRITFCLDTCHLFAAGYDIGNPAYVEMLEELIQTCLGWDNVVAIHLNDSMETLNCHKDRHADIGYGKININGLKKFIQICKARNKPMFLETPANKLSHEKQIEFIKMIISKSKS
ncbi:MAG: apurinic endonuclease [Hyperionvirus sp.]|uniref:Apurinic endonuclease n=1 Tax=Hyperionvirus sp. TaxID=2487770 RepID=A0A3G5AA41_9VIRU|nr:MAG: apurinic endonuclease [Hyperionvirus sp.]